MTGADGVRPSDQTDPATELADRADAATGAHADREPTPEEEQAAEEAAAGASPETAKHYREMTERGAEQQGEGRIEQ